jgi:hypothetical protein
MLCSCVSEEEGDGEGAGSEEPSLLSYTLGYISLAAESVRGWGVLRRDNLARDLCACVSK